MKFSCEKALLQSAIAVTSRAVAQKSSIPALEGLLLHADSRLTISGYNLQTGIRTKVSADVTEPGEIVLNARLFGDIIRRMPDDVVVFTADDKQLVHLSCGDADFDILGLSAADYPELPMVEDDFSVSIQQKLLRAMIEETAFAVSTNESRPIHTGALFEITDQGLTMVAVDGFRLAIRREPLEKIDGGAFSFVAPGSALGEVKNICSDVEDLAAVTLGKSHILFEVGDTELICRRLEGEFLDYKNAIPRKNPISVIADTKALIESIDRVSVVISEKQTSPVRCLVDHAKVLAYLICGLCCAIGGLFMASRSGAAIYSQGEGKNVLAISACVIGGVKMAGGKGTMVNVLIGILIMRFISTAMNQMLIPTAWVDFVSGALLVIILIIDKFTAIKKEQ